MGAYGSPEHLPGDNQGPQYGYEGNKLNHNSIIHSNIKPWQKVFLIIYSCIVVLFGVVMLVTQLFSEKPHAQSIIIAVIYIALSVVFINQVSKHKKGWPFLVCSIVAFFVYFGTMPDIQPSQAAIVDTQSSQVQASQSADSKLKTSSSAAQYKKQCGTYGYKDVARNPNDYKGKTAKFTGQVIQVQDSWGTTSIRLNVTKGDYGVWDDTIYVDYKPKDENESRILENDIITVYGELDGIKKYIAVLGNEISIPYLKAEFVEINPDTGSITKAKYDKIKTGMSYEQVKKIIGSDGKVLSEVGKKGSKDYTASYEWDGDSTGAAAILEFQGNKLQAMNQSGLQ